MEEKGAGVLGLDDGNRGGPQRGSRPAFPAKELRKKSPGPAKQDRGKARMNWAGKGGRGVKHRGLQFKEGKFKLKWAAARVLVLNLNFRLQLARSAQ